MQNLLHQGSFLFLVKRLAAYFFKIPQTSVYHISESLKRCRLSFLVRKKTIDISKALISRVNFFGSLC